MIKIFMLVLILFMSLLQPKPITQIETPVKIACIQLASSYGAYTYPSIYVTGLPADLEIIFSNSMTVYRFQGLGDTAIRAELPVGTYTVIAYYGKEQVSGIFFLEVKTNNTLMIHISIPEECYIKPVSINKQA
jgi:hypothetical protein